MLVVWYRVLTLPLNRKNKVMNKTLSPELPTTDQMNETIALFDGWQRIKGEHASLYKKDGKVYALGDFKYHTSWDWLMPVIKKILHEVDAVNTEFRLRTALIKCDREACHKAVYKFIVWYNQNKNQ